MASRFDLEPRVERLQAAGLVVESDYQGNPPKWLMGALANVDLRVLNCKGIKVDDTVVMVRLSKLEELLTDRIGLRNAKANDPMQTETPHAVHG
jgi:hypothetical protein